MILLLQQYRRSNRNELADRVDAEGNCHSGFSIAGRRKIGFGFLDIKCSVGFLRCETAQRAGKPAQNSSFNCSSSCSHGESVTQFCLSSSACLVVDSCGDGPCAGEEIRLAIVLWKSQIAAEN